MPGGRGWGKELKKNPNTVAQCRKNPVPYLHTLSRTIPSLYTMNRPIPYLYTLNRTIPYLNTLSRTITYLNTLCLSVPYVSTLSRTIPYLSTLSRTIPYLNTLRKNPNVDQNQILVCSQSEPSTKNPKTSSADQNRVSQCPKKPMDLITWRATTPPPPPPDQLTLLLLKSMWSFSQKLFSRHLFVIRWNKIKFFYGSFRCSWYQK